MFTRVQQEWLDHLSDTEKIIIIPYNPKTKDVFKLIKDELIKILGSVRILHRGSTGMKISGQGEIDLYIPVCKKDFDNTVSKLSNYLDAPRSVYKLKRAKFIQYRDDIKIEIFVINKNDSDWKMSIQFEKYLKNHPKALSEYEIIKTKANGLSVREYYTLKTDFLNKILKECDKDKSK